KADGSRMRRYILAFDMPMARVTVEDCLEHVDNRF
ncbi:hypothetical protein PSYMO_37372, partial [Pseudomonas amygdali pv. mori str. 301020]